MNITITQTALYFDGVNMAINKSFSYKASGDKIVFVCLKNKYSFLPGEIESVNGTPFLGTLSQLITALNQRITTDGNAPVNTVVPAITGINAVGNVLTCSTGTWTSDTGLIPPYHYQWYRGVTPIGTDTNTYTLVALDVNENIKCVVRACDSDGCTNANSNTLSVPTTGNLVMTFSDFSSLPSGITDPESLSEWNTLLSSNYTSLSITGYIISLIGGSGVILPVTLFLYNESILSVVDSGSVIEAHESSFESCINLHTLTLPECLAIMSYILSNCTAMTTCYLPKCTNLGGTVSYNSVFDRIEDSTITLTIPSALMTCNGGNPDGDIVYLDTNNTVTIVTV